MLLLLVVLLPVLFAFTVVVEFVVFSHANEVAAVVETAAGVGVVVLDEDADVLESLECNEVLTVKAVLAAEV